MKELRRSSLYERCAARTDRLTICAVLEVLSVQHGKSQALRAVALTVALRQIITAPVTHKGAVSPGVTDVASVAADPALIDFDFVKSVVNHVPKPAFLTDHTLSLLLSKEDMVTHATQGAHPARRVSRWVDNRISRAFAEKW